MHDEQQSLKLNKRQQPTAAEPSAAKTQSSIKKHLGAGAGGLLLVLAAVIFTLTSQQNRVADNPVVKGALTATEAPIVEEYQNEEFGVSFMFSRELTAAQLSEGDVQDGFLARLTSQSPPVVVSLRQETGLRAVAALTNTDIGLLLKSNVDRSLPDRYPGFNQESGAPIDIAGEDGGFERVFTYTGPSGELAKQRLLVLVRDDNAALYVSMQATEKMYDTVNAMIFEPLATSIIL